MISIAVMIAVTIAIMVTITIAMIVPAVMLVPILIVVAGQCETAEHQGHRDCHGCHFHAAHSSSHPAPSFAGLDCNQACPRNDSWDRFAKSSDADLNQIGCTTEHICLNLKRTLNLSCAITWE
jgi:hypothetical protein